MLLRRWQRKIEHLREQPEPVRMRAAFLMTGASGLVLVIIWVALLLPLQLRLNNRDSAPEVAQQSPPISAQVGGIQDRALPSNDSVFSLPELSPSPLPTHQADSLEGVEHTLPVELQP